MVARDGAIAVTGGFVLCALAIWFLVQANGMVDDTPRDMAMSKAQWYGGIGILALVPGLLGLVLRVRRPRAGRFLAAFGRMVVLVAAGLYLVGSLALVMLG